MSKLFPSKDKKKASKGCFIVLIGPDGCGKSTVTSGLIKIAEDLFEDIWHFHWRPKLLPKLRSNKNSENNIQKDTAPPSTSKYGSIISTIRYLYYWADFILGYWFIIYPKKIKSSLIIGERYFPDILVHPERYGFNVPRWLMRASSILVPQPDIIFLLTGDPDEIHARKQELTVEQIGNQLAHYADELTNWKTHALIDTSSGANHVIDEIISHIKNIVDSKKDDSRYSLIKKHAFPAIGTTKLLLDSSMPIRLASKLYSPSSISGKISLSVVKLFGYTLRFPIFRKIESYNFGYLPLHEIEKTVRDSHSNKNISISYYLGNKGPRSKVTAQISSGNKITCYTKIGTGEEVISLLENEYKTLNDLKASLGDFIPTPMKLINFSGYTYLSQTAPSSDTTKRPHLLTEQDSDFILKLFKSAKRTLSIHEYYEEHDLHNRINNLTKLAGIKPVISVLKQTTEKLLSSDLHEIKVGYCHGDYTAWNTLYLKDHSLYIFDWEYSCDNGPAISDLFHFLRMPRHMALKLPPQETVRQILETSSDHYKVLVSHAKSLDINDESLPEYLALYLIQEILRHAETKQTGEKADKLPESQITQIQYLSDCLSYYIEH